MMEKKIFLLADDDIDDREMFCEALSGIDSNIICRAVTDGLEALNMLNSMSTQPQLIFLDVNMPVMNGWVCLENLKQNDRYKQIPVIIISTSSSQRELDIAKNLGALCYFTKPHSFNDLIQVLRLMAANPGPSLALALQYLDASVCKHVHMIAHQ